MNDPVSQRIEFTINTNISHGSCIKGNEAALKIRV